MSKKRFHDADYERMAELREGGLSNAKIAKQLGCSEGLVAWTCLKLGAEPAKLRARPLPDAIVGPVEMSRGNHVVRRFSAEDDAKLLQLSREGRRRSEIARQLGRKPNSVQGRLMTLARREARREEAGL
jgi:DNA-binding CsgD family transcriptional regulator